MANTFETLDGAKIHTRETGPPQPCVGHVHIAQKRQSEIRSGQVCPSQFG
jgi:hypothetical protein